MIDVVDKVTPVERIVSDNVSMSTNAYTKPVITAVFPTGPYAAGVPVTLPVSITNPDGIPAPFELVFDLPAGTVINYGGTDYTCAATCPPIPVTLPLTPADFVITFDEAWTGTVGISLYDSDWVPADRLLADLTQLGVVVNGNSTLPAPSVCRARQPAVLPHPHLGRNARTLWTHRVYLETWSAETSA